MAYTISQLSEMFHKDFGKSYGGIHFSKIIFSLWEKYGNDLGYSVRLAGNPKEYLIDLCWIRDSSKERWMELALESEISNDSLEGIWEDFEKLLDIKARTKVGIFVPEMAVKQAALDMISEGIAKQRIRIEEDYLIIFIVDLKRKGDNTGNTEVLSYHINNAGEVTELPGSRTMAMN